MIRTTSGASPDAAVARLVPRPRARSVESRCGDRVEVLVPRYGDPFIRRFILPWLPRSRAWNTFPLDARGSRIWRLIDGRRNIAELVQAYRDWYPDDDRQVPQRVVGYLDRLAEHGFLEFEEH